VVYAHGPEGSWQSLLGQDHALVGRIWNVTAAHFDNAPTLVRRLVESRFVLLGEKHDNPDHHRLQAWLLQKLIETGRRPAVGFEMLTLDDEPAITAYVAAHPQDATGLGQAVGWQRRGWPDWAWYQPIADITLRQGLALVATDLPPSLVRDISSRGLAALDPSQISRLGLDRPLSSDNMAKLTQEIRRAHCGFIPDARVEAIVSAQRARDAHIAQRLAAVAGEDGAILIAGVGHVRRDYGVPLYLRHQAPGGSVTTVAFIEVDSHDKDVSAYAGRFHQATMPFDYVWFTPRVDDEDPCAKFEEQLKRFRQGS
jgi:uncharacterized iron-regulated protein